MADGDYITLADAKLVLDRVISIYNADDDHLTLILDEAEGMVNAAIASRYTIPVTDAEGIKYLRALVVPIMRQKTWTQFADQDDYPESIKVEYQATLKELSKLAKRETSLPGVSDKTTGRASHIKISSSTSPITGY